ncbi:hypothetical protein V8F33_005058 [Rhypophila sp. PSN 637]
MSSQFCPKPTMGNADPFNAMAWSELYHLMVTRYPDLPQDKALVENLRDLFVKYPKETGEAIKSTLSDLKKTFSEFRETIGEAVEALGEATGISIFGYIGRLISSRAKDSVTGSHIRETNQALEKIASELKTFNAPSLWGQMANINAILTSGAAVQYIKKMAEQAERIANGLEVIGDHVGFQNISGDRFPGHVYSYVRSMIERHQGERVPHYFFVFNQGTQWQAKFDDLNRADPLGPHCLGYSHDLDELVHFLVRIARPRLGPRVIFHILIPVVGNLAITESLTFPDEMGPFRVSGQLNQDGRPCVYLCMPLRRDRDNLRNVGSLKPRPRWVLLQQAGLCLPILGEWFSTDLEPIYFDNPPFKVTTSVGTPLYCSLYAECAPVPPRTLGTRREV